MTNEEAKKLSVLKITNPDTLDTVGRPLPGGLDDPGVYTISGSDQCLIGTAEIPVGGLHMDSILSESSLPLKYVAYSHCFRTEAGAAGAATRGLYRVHQFIAHQFITTGRLRLSDLPSYSVVLRCYISMER